MKLLSAVEKEIGFCTGEVKVIKSFLIKTQSWRRERKWNFCSKIAARTNLSGCSPTIKRLTEQQRQNVIYNTRCSTQFIIIHALAAVFALLPTIAGAAVKKINKRSASEIYSSIFILLTAALLGASAEEMKHLRRRIPRPSHPVVLPCPTCK